jgi:iduronate 2-sulfatase
LKARLLSGYQTKGLFAGIDPRALIITFPPMLKTVTALLAAPLLAVSAANPRPNVLFIAVDDLRPQILSFGRDGMVTPHLDALARSGVAFERAYCMVPTCGASRASLFSGIRPARNRFVSFTARVDEDAPGIVPLHTHFKSHGYHTVSLGKILHFADDNQDGWSEKPWRPKAETYALADSKGGGRKRKGRTRGAPYENADVADDFYSDGQIANEAVRRLEGLARKEQPFFLAVGFLKPHLPFVAPRKYWNLYPADKITLPDNYYPPKYAPEIAIHNSGELRAYAGVPAKGPVPDEMALNLIRGYRACVSYVDAQIGRVLASLKELGLDRNTLVVLWADHGWNLGEHTLWCKHCCFETSMNAPLLFRAPTLPDFQPGRTTPALAEFIDIYPTLCELAGLARPSHLQGASLVPVLSGRKDSVKDAAIGRFQEGDTIRTDRYRLTLYSDKQGRITDRMLYDHREDPHENLNLAGQPEHRETVERLTRQLRAGMGRPTK